MDTLIKGIAISVAAFVAWIVSLPHAILILLVVQVLDVVAGCVVAWGDRSISSLVAEAGIRKKIYAWIIIMLVGILQWELADYFPGHIHVLYDYTPLDVAALGFVFVESLSIIENAEKMGWWIPSWLRKGLEVAKEDLNE